MRKLSTTLALVGLLSPVGAQSLGVGEIKLQSSLNQHLRAEIPLVLSAERLTDLKVTLAAPKEFTKAGLERPHILTKLRFDAVRKPDGSFAVRVGSTDIIHEPFLSFLMEVSWPEGRVLRSFAVLLDPPQVLAKQTFPGSEAGSTEGTGDAASVEPPPSVQRNSDRAPESHHEVPLTAAAISGAVPTGSEYGPVRENEKLWDIAEALRSDSSVTVEQMVMALFRFNPHAFSRPNINALNSGVMLKVPDPNYIHGVSPSIARAEFYRHQRGGTGLRFGPSAREKISRAELPGSPAVRSAAAGTPGSSSDPVGLPAKPAPGPVDAQHPADPQTVEAHSHETEGMRLRLAELEKRVSDLQEALREKDAQRSQLQSGTEPPVRSADRMPAESPVTPSVSAPHVREGGTALDQAAGSSTVGTEDHPQVIAASSESSGNPVPSPIAADAGSSSASAANVAPADAEGKPEAANLQTASAERSAGAAESVEPGVWTFSGVGVVAASLLGAFLWRRRKAASNAPEEYDYLESVEDDTATGWPREVDEAAGRDSVWVPSQAASDCVAEKRATGNGSPDEVDPVLESDVYLAYGKHRQAEEAIRNAILEYPERAEYRLKLLEVYLAADDKPKFQDYALELKLQNEFPDPNFWRRVVEMGQKLCPENPLFRNGSEPTVPIVAEEKLFGLAESGDDTDELIAELKRFGVTAREKASQLHESSRVAADKLNESVHDIAWTSPEFKPPTLAPKKTANDEKASSVDHDHMIAFESSEGPSSQAMDAILTAPPAIHYQRYSEDHGDGNITVSTNSQPGGPAVVTGVENTLRTEGGFIESAAETGGSDGLLTDRDDLETRLDLARAYADMEDYGHAKAFLGEVMEKGTEQQKSEATILLSKLEPV